MKAILATLLIASLFTVGCSHYGKKHHKSHKKHWHMMDVDNDGAVSKKEFNTYHTNKFEKMDADKDGKVTKEEKREYMKSKKSCGCGDDMKKGKKGKKSK